MLAAVLKFFDGKKNYLFGLGMIVVAALNQFVPDFAQTPISILGMTDPSSLASTGLAWVLGREAIAKAGAKA